VDTGTFEDRRAATEYLAAHLPERMGALYGSSAKAAAALIDAFEQLAIADPPSGETRRAVIPSLRWVIRDEDLGLFESLSKVMQAAATGAAVLVPSGSPALAAVPPAIEGIAQLIKIGLAIRAKGAILGESELLVLMTLREHADGLSVQQLRERLPADVQLDSDVSLETVLHRLEKYPTRSGDVSLVWRSAAGLWHTRNV
jgi:hypothetical protein